MNLIYIHGLNPFNVKTDPWVCLGKPVYIRFPVALEPGQRPGVHLEKDTLFFT
jgi:hypothetical protein